MKKIFKAAASLALFGSMVSNIFALDFGGLFKNNTKVNTPDFSYAGLDQQDSLTGWIKVPLSKNGNLYFISEADATIHVYSPNLISSGADFDFMMNLNLLKLSYINKFDSGYFQFNLGRFSSNDITETIFSQEADGLHLAFSNDTIKLFAYAAYTGLTNSRYNSIVDSSKSTFVANQNLVYQFNSPYVLANLSLGLPYLFKNQSLSFEAVATIGLPGIFASNQGFNRFYGTFMMNGPLLSNLFYTASTTFGFTAYGDSFQGVSNLTKFSLVYYPKIISSSINFALVYASGNNGFLVPFSTFTSQNAYLAYDGAPYSGMLKATAGASIRPTSVLFLGLDMGAVFDCMDSFAYTGFQWNAQIQVQLFTDFKIGLNANQFYGADSAKNNTTFTLNAVLAF